jgi:hypothetical protein
MPEVQQSATKVAAGLVLKSASRRIVSSTRSASTSRGPCYATAPHTKRQPPQPFNSAGVPDAVGFVLSAVSLMLRRYAERRAIEAEERQDQQSRNSTVWRVSTGDRARRPHCSRAAIGQNLGADRLGGILGPDVRMSSAGYTTSLAPVELPTGVAEFAKDVMPTAGVWCERYNTTGGRRAGSSRLSNSRSCSSMTCGLSSPPCADTSVHARRSPCSESL